MFTKILDFNVFNGTKKEFINYINKFEKVNIISGNPEILYSGKNNRFLHDIYTDENSIIIPDGVGTVIASKIVKKPVKQKIAGIEVMEEIVKNCSKQNKGVYLIGAKQDIVEKCAKNLNLKYPDLNVFGIHDGYFDINNCDELIEDIKDKKPFVIFVAMGCPKQEMFIHKYFKTLPCKIFMGVGGSFDVFSGKVNRAPKWMINLGLEWCYRVVKEPARLKRLTVIPQFLICVNKNKEKSFK